MEKRAGIRTPRKQREACTKHCRFVLTEVHAGDHTGSLWVSLGFSSDVCALDVLHVVCGRDDASSKTPADSGLYFERFDQVFSHSGRATKIIVRPSTIRLAFSSAEARTLGFCGPVTFVNCEGVAGFSEAVVIFRAMAQHSRGRNVVVRVPDGSTRAR